MPERVKLTGAHIDEIAQILRLGLGLTLIGAGWAALQAARAGPLTPEALWHHFGMSGEIADSLTTLFFEWLGLLTPEAFLAFAGGLGLVGGLAVLAGLLTRPVAGLFGLAYAVPWLAGLFDALPWIWQGDDYSFLAPSFLALREPGIALLFLVLFNLGSGTNSLDNRFRLAWTIPQGTRWDTIAVQLRLALSLMLFSVGLAPVLFGEVLSPVPWYGVLFTGVLVFFGLIPRVSGLAVLVILLWGIGAALHGVSTFSGLVAALSPDAAFLGAAAVFTLAGSGERWKPKIRLTETKWGKVR